MESSIAEKAASGEAVEPEDDSPQVDPIHGSGKQLSLNVGGELATSSEFKLSGGSVPIEGQFDKGEIVKLEVEVRVGKIEFEDTVDPSGNVTRTVRRHIAKLESVQRA